MKNSKFLQKFFAGRVPLLLTLMAVTLIITALVMPKAFNRGNAQQIMNNLCFACVYGVGVSLLLMGGGFDFAASAHSTVATLVFLRVLESSPDMPWWVAAIAAICFGAFAGGVNAFLAHGLKLMPFIATIGMSSVWGGIAKWATKGNYVSINDPGFLKLTTARIGNTPIPVLLIFVIALVVIYSLMLKYTKFGRVLYAVGGNEQSAKMMGLNVRKVKLEAYVLSSVLCSIGGILFCLNTMTGAVTQAKGLEMSAIAAAVIGGTLLTGGVGNVWGSLVGVLITGTITTLVMTNGKLLSSWANIMTAALLCVFILLQSVFAYIKNRGK